MGIHRNQIKPSWDKYLPKEAAHIVDNITNLLFAPCDDPPSLWVTTGVPALLKAFTTILTPDFKEGYHKLVGQSLYHDWKQSIKDAHEEESVIGDGFRNFVFGMADKVDMASWYMFLAGVAEDGLLDWTSQVYKMANCVGDRRGHIKGTWICSATVCGQWVGTECVISGGSGGDYVGTTGLIVEKDHNAIIAVHSNPTTWEGTPVAEETRIYDSDYDETFASGTNVYGPAHTVSDTSMVYASIRPATAKFRHISWESYSGDVPSRYKYVCHGNMSGYIGQW